ncbi:MAG TPA: FAD-binding oxidoreductase [Blastocatellia bacterium]|nr:FAD-binding oxidoreductase [Blastocatellia bacterium]
MTEKADVVIIGGGIVGASCAYHLSELGCTDVLVIERQGQQGLGSTGKSAGGVRAQFATPINIQMSLYSIDVFSKFEELTGHSSLYRPFGYLFIATTEPHLEYLRTNRKLQLEQGVKGVEIVSREQIVEILPQVRSDDILGGSYCPTDGFVDPYSVMTGFTAKARQRGARVWLGTEVTGIALEGGRIKSVETSRGTVETRAVVNAAGAWAAPVAQMVGVDLPVKPLKRQIVNTEPFDLVPHRLPMVIEMATGFHFRREGTCIMMAWPEPKEVYEYDTSFDREFIEKILVKAVNRVPCFEEAQVNPRRCWAGLYEVTPDHHAIIGRAPGVEGMFLANGFSGHGVMHSPATGKIISEMIVMGASRALDASPLRMERFGEGKLLEETAVL